ncbi:MAG: hypothetical protein ACLFSQ_10560 [Candidatus Zixiibacteriota bacterium]
MKKLLLLPVLAILFFSCGGGKQIMGDFRTEGMVISYEPSIGNTLSFVNKSDAVGEVITTQASRSILTKSERQLDITTENVTDEEIKVSYTFGQMESGTFVNGEIQESDDEEDELEGQTLTIIVNREDGKMKDWEGLQELTFDEAGMNRGESMANDYTSIIFDYFPPKPVKIGSKWDVTNETKTSLEDGGFNEQSRTKEYELVDFVMYKGHKCAKVKVTIDINVNTETSGEDANGNSYDVIAEGMGEGRGEFYFDFENGHLVFSKYSWIIDLEQTAINVETGEKESYNMYQESHEKYTLKSE